MATNVYFLMGLAFVASLLVGILFYSVSHDWELSTSFYFASQVLLGNMYGIPEELDGVSQTFTMIYFLWGTSLVACCHLVATAKTNNKDSVHHLRLVSNKESSHSNNETGEISISCSKEGGPSKHSSFRNSIQLLFRVFEGRQARFYTFAMGLFWIGVGTAVG